MAEVRCKARIGVLLVVVSTAFLGIGFRLYVLHMNPQEWVIEPIEQVRRYETKPRAPRGRIIDCNGRILAMEVPDALCHVGIDPEFIHEHGDPETILRVLPAVLDIDPALLRRELENVERRYRPIKRFVPQRAVRCFRRGARGHWIYNPDPSAQEAADDVVLKGLVLDFVPSREYPNGPVMSHVIGYVNREGVGSAGIEQRMDHYLRGREGYRRGKRDGRRKEIYSEREVDIEPEAGATVMLTLDRELQYETEQIIERVRHEFEARAVWAIVQHVRTGEILAMASSPSYNPNDYSRAPDEWRRNRAISYNYEPGSTMKAAVIGAALDRRAVHENEKVDCENGYWVYGGRSLEDSHGEGVISVADVIKYSSNIGTAKIALKLGNQGLYDALRRFHFGERLHVGLPGEEAGIFYPPENWSKISITRIGMGHEIGVTALQVISMMSALANNGIQMKPYCVKRITSAAGAVLVENRPEKIGTPIGPSAARRMRTLLRRVTEEGGTGTLAALEGYAVAGKTGTAQKIRPPEEGGGYYAKNFISSFAGFLPAEQPEIAIIVVADDPGTYSATGRKINYYGGTVCGPAFREIAEFAVGYLRIAPEGKRIYSVRPVE